MFISINVTRNTNSLDGKENTGIVWDLSAADISLQLTNGSQVYLFGQLFYWRSGSGIRKQISTAFLKNIFSSYQLEDVISRLEGQYVGVCVSSTNGKAQFFSDRYARMDCFYAYERGKFYLSSDLEEIFRYIRPEYDQRMLSHLFLVYGWYAPKGHTIYKNVKRLKVGEILTVNKDGLSSQFVPFKPLLIEDRGPAQLDEYYKCLQDSIETRVGSDTDKIWVSSSSGWDSSLIIGMLVDMYGAKRVRMMSGSMHYSKEAGIINKFEVDKINKIGKFYGIKPEFVGFDFINKNFAKEWKRVMPFLKSRHMYTYTGYSFTKLASAIGRLSGPGQIVFNGETSDSFHNFGFSQFATFFHTCKSFTELADKMNCYLYGPSFLKKVFNGDYQKDKVFQIFQKMSGEVAFDSQWKDRASMLESYLLPLFYGGPRLPFARTMDNSVLTPVARKQVRAFPFREYMPEVLKGVNEKNIYAWIIHLYHSFHSQGSTVNILKHGMEHGGHQWRYPFNDLRLIEVLSQAPESWGRGLDFNHTKHPIKWVAQNKIKFPYDLLQEGPHSYLYDVIEGFSLLAEITYRSGATAYFKEVLRERPYKAIFDSGYFDFVYLDRLVKGYLSEKEVRGIDFTNLVSLITFCITGWY